VTTSARESGALYRVLRAIKPLRALVRSGRELLARHRRPVWRLTGQERTSGLPLEIVFAGQLENKNYIAELAYGGTGSEVSLGRKWVRDLAHRAAACGTGMEAMVFVEMDERQRQRFGDRFPFHVPCWVGGDIDLVAVMARLQHSKNAKEDMRRFRKSELGYQVTTDKEAFERFYHDMYLPYIKNVYGERAFLVNMSEFSSTIEHGELLLVKQREESIAGQIILYENGCARAWIVGIKDGDRAYVKAGAIKALDHFLAVHVSERGYRRLHQGASRPFLLDGVLHHKKRRGLRITDHAERGFAIDFPVESPAAWAFLASNPFVYRQNGQYRGAVFRGGDSSPSEEELRLLVEDLYMDGMEGLSVYLAGPARTPAAIPAELHDKVRIEYAFSRSGRNS
jgi:hypothetical protein